MRSMDAFVFWWRSEIVFFGVAAVLFGVTGHFVWAAVALGGAVLSALVLRAGLKYGKGSFRNVWRLIAERFAKLS